MLRDSGVAFREVPRGPCRLLALTNASKNAPVCSRTLLNTAARIHRDERKGDAPSDHVPVSVDLDLGAEEDDLNKPMIF